MKNADKGVGPGEEVAGLRAAVSPQAMLQALHDLEVHQVELAMQNEELRRTQAELDAARARYYDLYDLAPVGYCTLNDQGLILEANLTAARLLGVARGELSQRPISLFIFKTDQDIYYLLRGQLQSSSEPQSCELRMVRKDGVQFWAHLAVTAGQDAGGATLHRLVLTDVTDRRLMASAMRESEERFRTLIEWTPQAINVHRDGKFIYLNPAAVKLLGARSVHDMVGKPLAEFVHPDFHQLMLERVQSIAHTGYASPLTEMKFLKLDGTSIDVEAQGTLIVYDRAPAIHIAWRDITERKRVQALLAKTVRELNDVNSAIDAHAIVAMTDKQGKITYVNDKFCEISKYSRAELLGQDHRIVNSGFHSKDFIRSLWQTISDGGVWQGEIRNKAKDGTFYWVDTTIVPRLGEDGKPIQYIAIRADMTQRQLLDQTLQETNIELARATSVAEKANLAKSEFLSSMSHELRSPLNAILGFTQLLESGSPPPSPNQKLKIDQILRAGWYLLDLIDEILDLALIESGKLSLAMESISLPEVLLDCQGMIEPQAQKSGTRIYFPQIDGPCFVRADRTRLKQVIVNLLSNAIKYNRAGAAVEVSGSANPAGLFRISVQDGGEGLSPEKIAQLFQPFNRLGQETGKVQGTGIGLVVCKRLIELMGGEIGVHSTPSVGSVFWVELRQTSAPQVTGALETPASLAHQGHAPADAALRTLLYVEDNPANVEFVAQLIELRPNLRLLSAQDGQQGVAMARNLRPQVILMDINLPGISGFEALKILRADPVTAQIPVLALSANAMPHDIEKGLAAGFFRYITKPIKINPFMEVLDMALELAMKQSTDASKEANFQ
jgi:PAS domain S-box-containing protein